jgi:hypothetical protein
MVFHIGCKTTCNFGYGPFGTNTNRRRRGAAANNIKNINTQKMNTLFEKINTREKRKKIVKVEKHVFNFSTYSHFSISGALMETLHRVVMAIFRSVWFQRNF